MDTTQSQATQKRICIAIPSTGPKASDALDPRFGRCRWVLLYTPDDKKWQTIERDPGSMDSGAGRAAANLLSMHGATIVLAGTVGPKAATALEEMGIAFVENQQGICLDLVTAWLNTQGIA